MYDIVVRFPSERLAKQFIAQMTDGWGEGFCEFTPWCRKEGTDGTHKEDWEKLTVSAVAEGTPVCFVNDIFD